MEELVVTNLLKQVASISNKYKIKKIPGENFNIFDILKLSTKEVRTHSAFLAELLNPEGSHEQGDVFLRLFIEQLNIKDFNLSTAKVEVEKYIGAITDDETEGGNIDIIIFDYNRNGIIIENKIYAGDQKNQLLRYYNYGKSWFNKIDLLYLTLEGTEPSDFSTGNDDTKYTTISYKKNIKGWLEQCREKAVDYPPLKESIAQYINLIKKLTGQTMDDDMGKEIIKSVVENKENLRSALEIISVRDNIKIHLINKLVELLSEKFSKKNIIVEKDENIFYTKEGGFWFTKNEWRTFKIGFMFETRNCKDPFIGVLLPEDKSLNDKMILLRKKLDAFEKGSYNSDYWTWAGNTINTLNNDTYFWLNILEEHETVNIISEKISQIVEILDTFF